MMVNYETVIAVYVCLWLSFTILVNILENWKDRGTPGENREASVPYKKLRGLSTNYFFVYR